MSIWLEAARKARCQTDKTDKTDRTHSIQPGPSPRHADPTEVSSVLSVCQFEGHNPSGPADQPRSFSITGRPKTWTGRVVSLDEWRKLSAWDRHGPDERLFCGICQEWVSSFPECHGGDV
jgi:hypothetical protein